MNHQTPCDDCPKAQSCKEKRHACHAFALYVNDGRIESKGARKPDRLTYAKVMFYEEDNSLIRGIYKQLRSELLT